MCCNAGQLYAWAKDNPDAVVCNWEPWRGTPPSDAILARIGDGMITIEFLHAFATNAVVGAAELACVVLLAVRVRA